MALSVLKHVLHVEDELLIAMDVADTLVSAGVANVTQVGTCSDAMRFLGFAQIDAAILDISVADGNTDVVADRLIDMRVPFIFYTGSPEKIGTQHSSIPRLVKPVTSGDMVSLISHVLEARQETIEEGEEDMDARLVQMSSTKP